MRYLGIDYGSKKTGLALSDERGTMGFPHAVVTTTPRLAQELAALTLRERVGAIVIGESRNLEGGENPVAQEVRMFATELAAQTGLPIHFESEVYTSALARRPPEDQPKSRSPKVRAVVDASAAALILTSYLSKQSHE